MVDPAEALPGRPEPLPVPDRHFVNGNPLRPPFPDGFGRAVFGLGCFWGAERRFWQVPGVWVPAATSFEDLLRVFWESHDPTQGMRQGNDVGTQYRSVILTTTAEQAEAAEASRESYGQLLAARGYPPVTTQVAPLAEGGFYYAEGYHQQYLAKNPKGYCGLGGTGVACPIGTGVRAASPPAGG